MLVRVVPKFISTKFSKLHKAGFTSTVSARADFTHVVIGAGVVGLATARQLSLHPNTTTLLLERHPSIGTETSSRNSEVIHAGIYYGSSSLKTKLCIRGRHLLYDFCAKHAIPHRRTGKWIVAQNAVQRESLQRIFAFCRDEIDVDMRWVSDAEVERDGQGVRAAAGALESPTTGIVDSHGLMTTLLALFEEAGGVLALYSPVSSITPLGSGGNSGWRITTRDVSTSKSSSITAETIINAAGLGAVDVHNMIVPPSEKRQLFFAKGNYFSYSASQPRVSRLIYPAPEPGASGLGTHLTLDMAGRLRFGPDVEWVDSAQDLSVSSQRLDMAVAEIKRYLPGIDEKALEPDYAGIRPKLAKKGAVALGKGFQDFVIQKEDGYEGWVNLLGIESPGLTSSLAIGEMVEELLYGSVTK